MRTLILPLFFSFALIGCAAGTARLNEDSGTGIYVVDHVGQTDGDADTDSDSDSDVDTDADADTDSNPVTVGSTTVDDDGDGITESGGDCDDSNSNQFPGNIETPCNSVNDDCDDSTIDNPDSDSDGFGVCDNDCDDNESTVNPGIFDMIDGSSLDANCDGLDGMDADLDGDASMASGGGDCDDTNAAVYADASEVCDGLDNDCNTEVDDKDTDSDGFVDQACSAYSGGMAITDCDDTNDSVVPNGLEENGNGIDDNCNAVVDTFTLTTTWTNTGTVNAVLDWNITDLPLDNSYLNDGIKFGITDGDKDSLMGCSVNGTDCGKVLDYDPTATEGLGFEGPAGNLTYLVIVDTECWVWGANPSDWDWLKTGCNSVTFTGTTVNLQ